MWREERGSTAKSGRRNAATRERQAGLTFSWAALPVIILKHVSTGLSPPGPIALASLHHAWPPNCPMKGTEVLMPEVAILNGQCEGSDIEQPLKGTESLGCKSYAVVAAGNYAALSTLHPGHTHSWGQVEGQLPSRPSEPGVDSTLSESWSAHCPPTNTSDFDTAVFRCYHGTSIAISEMSFLVQVSQEVQSLPLSPLKQEKFKP